jgi:outer membrane protein assembly factor BamD
MGSPQQAPKISMHGIACFIVRRLGWVMFSLILCACAAPSIKDETAAMSTEKLAALAREEADAGSNEKAIKLYERLEGRAAGSLLGQQAQLERAYLLYKSNERPEALAVIERFLKLHPSSTALDYALYLQGLINFNGNLGLFGKLIKRDLSERDQQASRDAYQSFKQLSDQFPASKYTPDAQLRMRYIINSLATYEVHVARYYFVRGAYVAAANRAQQAIQEFQYAPAAQEALEIMVQSYDRLGLGSLRDDAARVLEKNFPDRRPGKRQI